MHPYLVTLKKPLPAVLMVLGTAVVLLMAYGVARVLLAPKSEWRQVATTTVPAPVASPPPAPTTSPTPSPSPSPTPEPHGDDRSTAIVNEATRKCMDDPASKSDDGTELIIWDCGPGKPNQRWTFTTRGELQVFGKCLDAAKGALAPGTAAAIRNCTGRTSQRWFMKPDGTIVSGRSGLCVEVEGGRSDNATPLRLNTCSGAPSQRWSRS